MYVKSIKSIHYIYIIDILFIYTYRYNFFPSASPPSAPALPSLPWPQRRVNAPGLEVDAVMPWTLDTMKVDECFNRVHLSLGWDSPTMGRWDEGDCYGG